MSKITNIPRQIKIPYLVNYSSKFFNFCWSLVFSLSSSSFTWFGPLVLLSPVQQTMHLPYPLTTIESALMNGSLKSYASSTIPSIFSNGYLLVRSRRTTLPSLLSLLADLRLSSGSSSTYKSADSITRQSAGTLCPSWIITISPTASDHILTFSVAAAFPLMTVVFSSRSKD